MADWQASLHFTLMTFFVVLFLQAALHKVTDLRRFSGYVANYAAVLKPYSLAIASVLAGMELLSVLLSVIPVTSLYGHSMMLSLLVIYAVAMIFQLRSGERDIDCGCGGPALRVSRRSVLRNVGLIVLVSALCATPYQPISSSGLVTALAFGLLIWVAYALIEQLLHNHDQWLKIKFDINKDI